jgi:hypothetical protein
MLEDSIILKYLKSTKNRHFAHNVGRLKKSLLIKWQKR